jgi:cytochrome-b5 reductase
VRDPDHRIRPYTPVSSNSDRGFFDLAIKCYPNGAVSSYLHSLQIGDLAEIRGPFEKLRYTPNMKRHIGMVAGGSGITPMLQILREINESNPPDRTLVKLLFANHEESDIIMKEELDALQEANPNIDIQYIVNSASSPNWKGYVGRLDHDLLHLELPAPCPDTLIYVCGPPSMMNSISGNKLPNKEQGPVGGILKDLGYHGTLPTLTIVSSYFVLICSQSRWSTNSDLVSDGWQMIGQANA